MGMKRVNFVERRIQMGIPQLRTEVENLIKRADDRLLQMVYALAVTYDKGEIVAYTTAGDPLTEEAYLNELEEGRQDMRSGRTINSEELRKRIDGWKEKYSK